MLTTDAEVEAPTNRDTHGWVAVVGADDLPADVGSSSTAIATNSPGGSRITLTNAAGGGLPGSARDARWLVAVDGCLHNADELGLDFGLPDTTAPAAIVLAGVRRLGLDRLLPKLRGIFAVLVWDGERGVLSAARDQIGIHPLYWARSTTGIAVSSSVEALLRQPGVSRDLDPVALAEYLGARFAPTGETFYSAVRRCLPATVTTVDRSGVRSRRYWSALPAGEPVQWLDEEAAEGFDGVFTRAIARSIGRDEAALFLSGGLDSIAVGAVAADLEQRGVAKAPLALSLGFEESDCDERDVQKRVAADLGLEQVLLPFSQAAPPARFIRSALQMGAGWPFPMWNVWSPAYAALAREGRRRGCGVVLTGRGGDEWLTVSRYYAADLARRGNLYRLLHLLWSSNRSRKHTGLRYSWRLLIESVGRPLAGAALDATVPAWWHRQRRERMRGRLSPWIAPDRQVRAAMDARLDAFIAEARPRGGFYAREMLATLAHPCVTGSLEETYEFGRRVGIRQAHPYWDVDLVEFLCRMPPRMLDVNGRSKAPLRRMLQQRFPSLGFERQKKAHALRFFDSMMRREAPAIWRGLGGLQTLHALGVVDAPAAERQLKIMLEGPYVRDPGRVLEVLTLETWARHRMR